VGVVVVGGDVDVRVLGLGALDEGVLAELLGAVAVLVGAVELGDCDGVVVGCWVGVGFVGCRSWWFVVLWCDPPNAAPSVVWCPVPDSDCPSAASIPVTIPIARANVAAAPTPASAQRFAEPGRIRGERVFSAGSSASGRGGWNPSTALRIAARPRSTECS